METCARKELASLEIEKEILLFTPKMGIWLFAVLRTDCVVDRDVHCLKWEIYIAERI